MTSRLSVEPSARRLTNSLRDIGYSFESAVADLVDNSIAAGATSVDIRITFDGLQSSITISDNGVGMNNSELNEAMRFGSRREYSHGDLGRYGLGLKTASLSQCRRLEVISVTEEGSIEARALDLDFIEDIDDWLITDISDEVEALAAAKGFNRQSGTLIKWSKLDRLLPVRSPEGGWARRRIEALPEKLNLYLGMVFHRFLQGEAKTTLEISVNGNPVKAWDPFARSEANTTELISDEFEIESSEGTGTATLKRYLLPTKNRFSTSKAYEYLSGIEKWNKQQGLYIYRGDRLVQWGGWAGIRTIDEHTKFARASLDFETTLDSAFNINVAKMRVSLPAELRKMLSRPINELCIQADAEYRKAQSKTHHPENDTSKSDKSFDSHDGSVESIGLTLRAAAARTGQLEALSTIMELVKKEVPELAAHLGFE